jgi:hypothetical protein
MTVRAIAYHESIAMEKLEEYFKSSTRGVLPRRGRRSAVNVISPSRSSSPRRTTLATLTMSISFKPSLRTTACLAYIRMSTFSTRLANEFSALPSTK